MGCQEHVHKLGYRTNQNIQKSNLNLERLTGHPSCYTTSCCILEDVLNESKSIINRFSDGRIMNIEKYVFKKNITYPPIFKISQLPTFTFITDLLFEAISDANLTGICMERCEIKSNWLFWLQIDFNPLYTMYKSLIFVEMGFMVGVNSKLV